MTTQMERIEVTGWYVVRVLYAGVKAQHYLRGQICPQEILDGPFADPRDARAAAQEIRR